MSRMIALLFLVPSIVLAESSIDRIPRAKISIGSIEQTSALGSFCWHEEGSNHFCLDTGLVSPTKPINTKREVSLLLSMPNQRTLKHLNYSFVPVSKDLVNEEMSTQSSILWNAGTRELGTISLEENLKIMKKLSPGLYVFSVGAWWENGDDAKHGFLINVTP